MDAIDLLREQHREVESLFEQIKSAEEADEKIELVQELADNFAAHATIEEKLFYPAAYGESTQKVLDEAVEEHLSAKRLMSDILSLDAGDESLDAKLSVLKEQIEHHVQEEEYKLFPRVRREFEAEVLETLGDQMEELFENEMASEPAEHIQTERAARIKPKRQRPST